VGPSGAPSEDHRCVAIAGPRVLSLQQQELVCLRPAHVDCPRYRRAVAAPKAVHGPIRTPAMPKAIAASLVVLALSAGISFGFVVQRGGIDLPASAAPSGAAAAVTAGPTAFLPTAAATGAATPESTPLPTAAPTAQPTVSPAAAESPTAAISPTVVPPAAPGVPSASRLAVLKPCSSQTDCYVYTIRSGDNLVSIANWFGVPLDTIYAWNPAVKHGIHPGDQIKIPTPTR